jgi:hypothetical protein
MDLRDTNWPKTRDRKAGRPGERASKALVERIVFMKRELLSLCALDPVASTKSGFHVPRRQCGEVAASVR